MYFLHVVFVSAFRMQFLVVSFILFDNTKLNSQQQWIQGPIPPIGLDPVNDYCDWGCLSVHVIYTVTGNLSGTPSPNQRCNNIPDNFSSVIFVFHSPTLFAGKQTSCFVPTNTLLILFPEDIKSSWIGAQVSWGSSAWGDADYSITSVSMTTTKANDISMVIDGTNIPTLIWIECMFLKLTKKVNCKVMEVSIDLLQLMLCCSSV